MNREPKRWIRQRWPVLVMGVLLAVAVLFSLFGEVGIVSTLDLHRKQEQLAAENAKLSEENEHLRQEVQRLRSNAAYIEELARKELGLMRKKEIVIPLDRKKDASARPPRRGETTHP